MFHGANDERLWPIGTDASQMLWLPVPTVVPQDEPDLCSNEAALVPGGDCYASIFCAGHVVLPNGQLFVAGGNVTGSETGGGLFNTWTFDPALATPQVLPYGWTERGSMAIDRWYPTLTVLPDA